MRLLALSLCGTMLAAPALARPDAPAPILTSPEAHDTLSYAKSAVRSRSTWVTRAICGFA